MSIPKTLTLTIPSRPVPKKNSPVMIAGRNLILPSKAFRKYAEFCLGTKKNPGWLCQWGNIQFTGPVRVDAHYWLPDRRWLPDLVGLMQGTGDLLEKAGLILNDKYIVSWGTSIIKGFDKENPRVDITISEYRGGNIWQE